MNLDGFWQQITRKDIGNAKERAKAMTRLGNNSGKVTMERMEKDDTISASERSSEKSRNKDTSSQSSIEQITDSTESTESMAGRRKNHKQSVTSPTVLNFERNKRCENKRKGSRRHA